MRNFNCRQKVCRVIIIFLFLAAAASEVEAQHPGSIYAPGDWITYRNNRIVTSVTVGPYFVYFGTTGGIIRYHKYNGEWGYPLTESSSGLVSDLVEVVAYDKGSNLLWVATDKGISKMDPSYKWFTNLSKSQIGLTAGDRIYSIGLSKDGLYLESSVGFTILDRFSGFYISRRRYPADNVEWYGRMSKPVGGDIPFITGPELSFLQRGSRGHILDEDLREYAVLTATVDEQGSYWAGTCGVGVLFGEVNVLSLEGANYGILEENVTAVALEKDKKLWVGGAGEGVASTQFTQYNAPYCGTISGLTIWDMQSGEWRYVETTSDNNFNSAQINDIEVGAEAVWTGTQNGIVYYDLEELDWRSVGVFGGLKAEKINDTELFGRYLWIGTDYGLQVINRATKTPEVAPVLANLRIAVYSLAADGEKLWIGTSSGVFEVDSKRKTLARYTSYGELMGLEQSGGGMVVEVSAENGRICFGDTEGISYSRANGEGWERLPGHPALLRNRIRDLQTSGNYVWAATREGLLRYNAGNKSWRLYTKSDGLANNSVNALLMDGDYIWIGTRTGLTRFFWNDSTRADVF